MAYVIGIMTGTSLDGIDIAIVDIDNVLDKMTVNQVAFKTFDYPTKLVKQIKDGMDLETNSIQLLSHLNFSLGQIYADCVIELCREQKIKLQDILFIASHGQTMFHHPEKDKFVSSTLQLGEPAVIAERTGINVVSNFREADIASGGQGAPIVPFSEFYIYKSKTKDRILQNIGGIGNLTYIPKNSKLEDLIAFDTGPGNMIIDAFCQKFYGEKYDKDGIHASNGTISDTLLNEWMNLPYFEQPFPKTTGRELFGDQFIEKYIQTDNFLPDDLIATATAFTAESIAYHIKQLNTFDFELILGGGGAHNNALIEQLSVRLKNTGRILIQEDLGYSSDAKEAVAMAVLGWHTWHKIPSNVPSATGAKKEAILGRITSI